MSFHFDVVLYCSPSKTLNFDTNIASFLSNAFCHTVEFLGYISRMYFRLYKNINCAHKIRIYDMKIPLLPIIVKNSTTINQNFVYINNENYIQET